MRLETLPRSLCPGVTLQLSVKGLYIASPFAPFLAFACGNPVTLRSQHFLFGIPVLSMSFVDGDSFSLAGLDQPDFLHSDHSFPSVPSLTPHRHSSCTTPTCMGDSCRRSPNSTRSIPVATAEVCLDIHINPPVLTSHSLHRIFLRSHPVIKATSSSLFHPFQKFLPSTSQSSGTYAAIHPLLSTSLLPSWLENPPAIPRSAPPTVTM